MAHLGSIRTVCNQSPQMKHARNASRRLTANFDVGSFQWKKDAKLMNDHIPGVWYFFTSRLRICFGQFDMAGFGVSEGEDVALFSLSIPKGFSL